RLVLGEASDEVLGDGLLDKQNQERDVALGYLYNREYGRGRNVRGGPSTDRRGGDGAPAMTVPEWINDVHRLFPQETIERIEKDALERYQLDEMVTNPDLLKRATPSMSLLKAVLHTRHLMNKEVLALARDMVRKVVQQLMEKLARPVHQPFTGSRDRRRRSSLRVARNFDPKSTIRHNLKFWDPDSHRLFIRTPHFISRVKRHADRWQIIVVVDESGSMMASVIHAAVTAAIFWGIKTLRTHLVLFDTEVVDVTDRCSDPVETIMNVQLGGGTDIGKAMVYAASLIEDPRKAIVVLISDFFEGGSPAQLLGVTKKLVEGGSTVLGLAALDEDANPTYDHEMAQRMANLGAHVGAMTPGQLAEWVAQKVG
ncbi:MAG: VWA domain-containing protein, partial [Planctomycetota bacterium]